MNKDLPVGGGVVRSPEKAGRLPGAGRGGCDENREHAYRWSWPVASHGDRGGKALAAVDCGEPVPAPKLQVGEKWVSRNEKGAEGMREVVAFEGDLAQIKWTSPAAEPDKEGVVFIDPEGVIRKAIRPNGEVVTKQGRGRPFDLIGQRELDFPLQVGKTWNFGYMSGSGDFGTRYYRVVACEEVSTTAGKFSALKIEAEIRVPRWSGTYHFWYAPKVKNNVKWKFPGGFGRTALDSELVKYEVK